MISVVCVGVQYPVVCVCARRRDVCRAAAAAGDASGGRQRPAPCTAGVVAQVEAISRLRAGFA